MRPPVTAVLEGHRALEALVAGLTDAQVGAASPLPGWTRGHVLAHLTDNARMFARLAEHALRGELVPTYDGGMAERDAIIEAAAGRSAAEHRAELARQTARLTAVWDRVREADWSRPVTFRNGSIGTTVFARWRESWIHAVDLDLGVRPDDWPAELAAHAVDFLLGRLPAGTRLRAEDVPREWSVDGGAGAVVVVVTGRLRDLAAWLAGRAPTIPPTAAAGLPDLGPWPPHPAPAAGGTATRQPAL
ncbi:maleylpyruvate isomerase family mycothiol-dependent enzyme [Streptomyces sp. 8K308]|uniref:maleylpyruvate isomerase family mycothiol-dependent enzyme n=1 Tax=Streptomyces sp. 8K308 TaxID=2530388 RepID=UPI00104D660D|nr:maleylpyruvate isomerase family mycothiol-dependent enzyme [Streptomyces sp. 8K308]TDC27303.1 maleylpyruvate isomerase family mycothiol-dependent enzyme [Streptomyces sp. 8K308]